MQTRLLDDRCGLSELRPVDRLVGLSDAAIEVGAMGHVVLGRLFGDRQ
jgi:hypothetical protein